MRRARVLRGSGLLTANIPIGVGLLGCGDFPFTSPGPALLLTSPTGAGGSLVAGELRHGLVLANMTTWAGGKRN